MNRLGGTCGLVTGAGSGIGQATALALAREGAHVFCADIDADAAARTAAAAGGTPVTLDVTREDQWRRALDALLEARGRLDVLVNNAGTFLFKPLTDTTVEDFERVCAVNVDGVFLGCRLGVEAMRRSAAKGEPARGSIINIASFLANVAIPDAAVYAATKGAVRVLTKSVAVECGKKGEFIRVNSVHPGMVRTPMLEALLPADAWTHPELTFERVPAKTWCTPEDIAAAVVFLASEESAFITGTELPVDGGYTAA